MFSPEDMADIDEQHEAFESEKRGLEKRTWVYAGTPASYGIAGCPCGNNDCQYSEYVDHLWCEKCKKDFVPEHWGLFDGPIALEACEILGISFDRIDLVRVVEWFDLTEQEILQRLEGARVETTEIGGEIV